MAEQKDLQQNFPLNLKWNTRFKRYSFAPAWDAELQKLFGNAEGLLQKSRVIKNSRSTSAGIFSLNGTEYFIKRSNVNGFFESLRRIGRMSRAERNRLVARRIECLGIRTPAIYAAVETMPWRLPGASYLITESFPHPMTVAAMLRGLVQDDNFDRQELIRRIAVMAVDLHDNGIEHGDFKLNNVLAYRSSAGALELGIFDLDGSVLHRKKCSDAVRIRELARLASSMFIRCCELDCECDFAENLNCWAKAYADAGGKDYSDNKEYYRRTVRFVPEAYKNRIVRQ